MLSDTRIIWELNTLTIVRMSIGHSSGKAPDAPEVQGVLGSSCRYYRDFQTYLMALVGLAQMLEAAGTGTATPYRAGEAIKLGCATDSASWYWCPETTAFASAGNYVTLPMKIERISSNGSLVSGPLQLGALVHLLEGFGQVLATSFFERNRAAIESKFGSDPNAAWPSVWNFARVVRNAMAHGGMISFTSPTAPNVGWRGLAYSTADNGRNILHTDLWPGDLLDLIAEMDSHL